LGYLKNSLLLKSSEKVFENTIYIDEGQGAPIILLHGLFGALSNFDALKELLIKNNYRVIIPKLPLYIQN
jgi:esterase/lipase